MNEPRKNPQRKRSSINNENTTSMHLLFIPTEVTRLLISYLIKNDPGMIQTGYLHLPVKVLFRFPYRRGLKWLY